MTESIIAKRLSGISGSDVVGVGNQTYNPAGNSTVQITASANNGGPWGDFQPAFGGMGVGTGIPVIPIRSLVQTCSISISHLW
jgi:hypothetical protein